MNTLVLVGAGHAHVEVLRRFGHAPLPGVRIKLITPTRYAPYSGMLPGLIAGYYGYADTRIDVAALARFAGAELVLDTAVGLSVSRREIRLNSGLTCRFSLLSLDTGSVSNTEAVPGATEYVLAIKPICAFLQQFEALLARIEAGASRHLMMVGAGAGGVEVLLAVADRLRTCKASLRYTLVTDAFDLLPEFPMALRRRLKDILHQHGVTIRTGAAVALVNSRGVVLETGEAIAADEILWTARAAPPNWLNGSGLPRDTSGFLRVDATLQAASGVYAAGDMIAFSPRAIARSGVNAVRAGPVLASNLRAELTGGPLIKYRPPRTALAIITTGEQVAVATRNGLVAGGRWAWWLKDHIDRKFLIRYAPPY